jgi:resolvase-like protein
LPDKKHAVETKFVFTGFFILKSPSRNVILDSPWSARVSRRNVFVQRLYSLATAMCPLWIKILSCNWESLTDGIDTKTPAGRFSFHVMASLAQRVRELIVERTCAGLEAARRRGPVGGRKRLMTDKKLTAATRLLGSGTPPHQVSAMPEVLNQQKSQGTNLSIGSLRCKNLSLT